MIDFLVAGTVINVVAEVFPIAKVTIPAMAFPSAIYVLALGVVKAIVHANNFACSVDNFVSGTVFCAGDRVDKLTLVNVLVAIASFPAARAYACPVQRFAFAYICAGCSV